MASPHVRRSGNLSARTQEKASPARKRTRQQTARSRFLQFESLEDRRVMATYPVSLAHYWSFDEATSGTAPVVNKISAANTGTFTGTAAHGTGLIGAGSARLNNVAGDGVNVGAANFSFTTGISVEAVIQSNWNGAFGDYDEIFRKEDGGNRILLSFQNDINNPGAVPPVAPGPVLSFGLNVGGVYTELDMPLDGVAGRPTLGELTDSTPDHIVASYDAASGVKAIYVNGTLRYSTVLAGNITSGGGAPGTIGNHGTANEPFTNKIDEVAIYSAALTGGEVAAHYANVQQGRNYFYDGSFDANEQAPGKAGDAAADTFTVRSSAGGYEILVNGVSVALLPSSTSSIVIDGSSDDDKLVLDLSAGDAIPVGGIIFNGGVGGNDSLELVGGAVAFADVNYRFDNANDGRISIGSYGAVDYTGLDPIIDNLSATTRNFNYVGATETITVTDTGGADGMSTIASTLGESVTFVNPTQSLSIDVNSNGGSGDDTITLTSIDAAFRAAITITAGSTDTANFNSALVLGDVLSTGNLNVTAGIININQSINTTAGIAGTVSLTALDLLNTAGAGDITTAGSFTSSATTQSNLAGDVTTTGDAININGAVVLTGNVAVASAGGTITFGGTVNDDAAASDRSLSLDAGAGNVNLNGAVGGTLPLSSLAISGNVIAAGNVATATQLSVTNAGISSITGVISGAGQLVKQGAGQLTLGGANTYSGITTVNTGTLRIASDGNLGAAPGAFVSNQLVLNGGILSTSAGVTLAANRGVTVGASGGTLQLGGALNYAGRFTGAGNTLATGGSDLVLTNGTGTPSDVNFTLNSSRLFFNSNNALGTGSILVQSGARLVNNTGSTAATVANPITVASGGGLAARVTTNYSNAALPTSGSVSFNNDDQPTAQLTVPTNLPLTGNLSITVGGNNAAPGAAVLSGVISGSSNLTLASTTNPGVLSLTGVNTYSGTTTITAGVLAASASTGIGDGSATNTLILNGGTLRANATIASPATRGVTLNGTSTSTIDTNNTSITIAGVISGGTNGVNSLSVASTGGSAGNLVLSGNNTFQGNLVVNRGGITVQNSNALGASGAGNFTRLVGIDGSSAARLLLNNGSSINVPESLQLAANSAGRVTLEANSAAVHTWSGPIDVTSTGNLINLTSNGTGALTITGDISGALSGGAVLLLRGGSTNAANHLQGSVNITGGNLSKTDGSLWVVGAAGETYSWPGTSVSVGQLRMNLANILPATGTINIGQNDASAATLNLNGFSQTTAGITFSQTGGTATANAMSITTGSGTLTLNGNMTYNATVGTSKGTGLISGNLNLGGASRTFTINDSGQAVDVRLSAIISNGGLVKAGAGTLELTGANTYAGATQVNVGILSLGTTGSIASSTVTVASGATLMGTGTTGPLTIDSGATHRPGNSPGITTVSGNYTENGTLEIELLNHTGSAGVGYDQVDVTSGGTVTLGAGAILTTPFLGSAGTFLPTYGQVFTIINNDGVDPVTGTFVGLANGAPIVVDGQTLEIYYAGGDGNDVVLVSTSGTPGLLYVNDEFTTLGVVDGDAETAGTQTAYVGINAFASIDDALAAYPGYAGPIVVNGGVYASATLAGGGAVTLRLVQDIANGELDVTLQSITGDANDSIVTRFNNVASGALVLETGSFPGIVSGAGGIVKQGVGTASLSGANTYSGTTTVAAGVLNIVASATVNPLSNSAVILSGGQLDVDTLSTVYTDALGHFGYHINNDGLALDLTNNLGVLNGNDPSSFSNFEGLGLLTNGPGNRGLDFDSDADFTSVVASIRDDATPEGFVISQPDNYTNLWFGTFTPNVTGTWGFRNNGDDDIGAIWLDVDQDGLFESNPPGRADNRGEQISYENTTLRTRNLVAGQKYLIAVLHREGTGGSGIDIRIDPPPAGSEIKLKPTDLAQLGLFSFTDQSNITLGNNVTVSANSSISASSAITFGSLTMASTATELDIISDHAAGTLPGKVNFSGVTTLDGVKTFDQQNSASLSFNGVVQNGTVAGGITKTGSGNLLLNAANTFTGDVTVSGGIVALGNNAGLGSEVTGKTVVNGGTLDIRGFRAGANGDELVEIQGTGLNGFGAILNTGASQTGAFRRLTLTGNATIRTDNRIDVRNTSGASTLNMNGFTLTKTGAAELAIVNTTIANPGSVNVNETIFRLEGSTIYGGAGIVSVANGATLDLWANTQTHSVNVTLAGGANLTANGSGNATLSGTVLLNGVANINTNNNSGLSNLNISGAVTGSGGINKGGTERLTLSSNASTYGGITTINAGTLVAAANNALGATATGTSVIAGATLRYEGATTPAPEPLAIIGNGVGNVGALQSATNDVTVTGLVRLLGNTFIASNTAGRTLTLDGPLLKEQPSDLTLMGAGNFDINADMDNGDFSIAPFTARVFNGVQQTINDATVINNDLNGTTVATRTNTLNGPLTFANAAAFNTLFTPSVPLGDNFTTVFVTTLTVTTPGIYTFSVTNNDDGAAVWLKPSANPSFVAGDLLQGIVANSNTGVVTRNLAVGTYTLVYAHREGSGGESVTGRIAGPLNTGITNGTLLPIVAPVPGSDQLIKTGTGTATLSGNNTYAGVTLVQQGVLVADANNALGATAPVAANVNVGVLNQEWQLGTDNNANSEFSQENGSSNAAPGSATARDDDWYFAGTYPGPIGVVAANEAIGGAPATGFERALTVGDPTNRIHFNLAADQVDDNYNLVIDTVSSSFTAGSITLEVRVNGNVVHTQTLSADTTITTATFSGTAVGLTTGDNVVTLTRTGLGAFLQFDYIRLNRQMVIAAEDTQVEAGAKLVLSNVAYAATENVRLLGSTLEGTGTSSFGGTVELLADSTINVLAAGVLTLQGVIDDNAGGFGVTKTGPGTLELTAGNTYSGATNVTVGELLVNNTLGSGTGSGLVVVSGTAILRGTGSIAGTVSMTDSSRLEPGASPETLATGSLSFTAGTTFNPEIGGTAPGNGVTGYDQVNVTGTVSLGGATLDVDLFGGFTPDPLLLQEFVIITNDGTDAVVGTFAGLAEGAAVVVGGSTFYISYSADSAGPGAGNDVALYSQPIINGTAGADIVTVTAADGAGNITVTYSLNNGAVIGGYTTTTPPNAFTFYGGDSDDTLNVNLNAINVALPGGIYYDGEGQGSPVAAGGNPSFGDVLAIVGNGNQTATYTSDAVIARAGTITSDALAGTITFRGLEPVNMFNLASAVVNFGGAADTIDISAGFGATVATSAIPALVVSGNSGGVAFEQVHLSGNIAVEINTVTGGSDAADSVTITSGANAHANANITIDTGVGADTIEVDGPLMVGAGGAISLTSGGSISVNNTITAGLAVTLTALTGSISDGNGASVNVATGLLVAQAATGVANAIDLDTTITSLIVSTTGATNGNININETSGLAVSSATTVNGNITLTAASGDIAVTTITAVGDATLVATTGAITDANAGVLNVSASNLSATSASGIDLDTSIATLTASVTGTGAIDIDEASAITLTSITTNSGLVDITSATGTMTVTSINAAGAVNLAVTDTGAADDDIIVSGTLSSTSNVVLLAGDDATLSGTISATGTVSVTIDAASADVGGAVLSFAGDIDAVSATFTGGAEIDTFNVRPDQDNGLASTPISIFGGNPTVPAGDLLVLDITGLGVPTLTLGAVDYSGVWSFGTSAAGVAYTSIETVQTTPLTSVYNLVLDMRIAGFQNGAADAIEIFLSAPNVFEVEVNGLGKFSGQADTINSFTVIGSSDSESLTIRETAAGLPSFDGAAPLVDNSLASGGVSNGAHLNTAADTFYTASNLTDVTIHFDGGLGDNSLALELITAADVGYFSDVLDGQGSGNVGVGPSGAPLTLVSFADLDTLILDGAGGNLVVDASSSTSTADIEISDDALLGDGVTEITADTGLVATTTFEGFLALDLIAGGGNEAIDLVNIDSTSTLTSIDIVAGSSLAATDNSAHTVRIHAIKSGVPVTVTGDVGVDTFQVFDSGNSASNIASTLSFNGVAGDDDALIVDDSGSVSADSVVITRTTIEGLTIASGTDITFTSIDDLDVTTSGGADTIRVNMTEAANDLDTAVVTGAGDNDQFYVNAADFLARLTLNGGLGDDTFGGTPSSTAPGYILSASELDGVDDMIRPSLTTPFFINGNDPTVLPGDVLNIDVSALGGGLAATSPVLVSSGQVLSSTHATVTFTTIEDLNLTDDGEMTSATINDIYIRGTNGNDTIQFARANTTLEPSRTRVQIGSSYTYHNVPGKTLVYGRGGNDIINQSNLQIPAEFYGEAGDDFLTGSFNNDLLVGGLGNDRINASSGNNIVWGDDAPTSDELNPHELNIGGNDTLSALGGNDLFYAGGGNDSVSPGAGDDWIHGGYGNDQLSGSSGNDRIYGAQGNDTISGDVGDDFLSGGDGDDRLYGRDGNDVLIGGDGVDLVDGGNGNDLVLAAITTYQGTSDTATSNTYNSAVDAAMLALLVAWNSGGPVAANLTHTDDFDRDTIYGGSGNDLFGTHTNADPLTSDIRGDFNNSQDTSL
ncbi:autotransporter-associated beta strand repeat protein [Pirellula staleyi DSM 6068]|uniref:Autotransporter-associated beta strand repeat protein n=1 Tax=Pirellula staleyi (strain ATCC 27377 / DSM 6068 / ICPB 4128) TaxID=530564 RepID=D2R3J6_PIRSD|nr:autotransporter-associated beta strand repeat-containing protein [Pirellula staleyi]ADB16950.1 autotransporter-associated beta strand repeat protein [Pirellula staleyi DSM 6068]